MRKSASQPVSFENIPTWNTNLTIGDKLEGVYEKKDEFISNKFENRLTTKYTIVAPDGTKYGVYGSASLNRQFAVIPEGSYVWIEYTGEVLSKNGRNVKTYVVDYDDEYKA